MALRPECCWNYHGEAHWNCGDATCFHVSVDVLSKAPELEACLFWTIPLYELRLVSLGLDKDARIESQPSLVCGEVKVRQQIAFHAGNV